MAPEQDSSKRMGRKLTKKRKPLRASSVQYPERLKEGEDVNEDVTADKGQSAQHMNQPIYSMIYKAGSKVDFHARFDEDSSESEEEQNTSIAHLPAGNISYDTASKPHDDRPPEDTLREVRSGRQQDGSEERKSIRSLPKLNMRTIKERNYMSQSTYLPSAEPWSSKEVPKGITPRDAPVMSKMLEAQAVLSPSTLPSHPLEKEDSGDLKRAGDKSSHTSLSIRLKEIFGFKNPEEVISGVLASVSYFVPVLLTGDRIPLLAPAKRIATRLYVHHSEPHLLLRIFSEKIRKLSPSYNYNAEA